MSTSASYINNNHSSISSKTNTSINKNMTMTNKLLITLLLFISLSLFHSLAFHHDFAVELEEFEPPHHGEQERPSHGPRHEGWEEESTDFPYHFRKQSFKHWFQSKEGFVKILPKFTKRSPKLFRGIENYRFSVMEMEPLTFLLPHHFDAVSVVIILQGKGFIEFVTDETKESFHITKGDAFRIPSGVTHFVINTNQTVPLRFAKIAVPLNSPGQFKHYFPARSKFQQSYFSAFNSEVVSTSLNIPEDLARRLVSGSQEQKGQGIIRRISEEQIKELTEHAKSPSNKHKDKSHKHKEMSKKWTPFNILKQDPIYSNHFGHFHEAKPENFVQLQDLHLAVSFLNMTQGSLFLPHYNTKKTLVAFVENGCARFEMASPYKVQGEQQQQWWPEIGEEEEEVKSRQVHKIVSRVCKGEVFIVPAGHPFAILSQDENFAMVGFGINALTSERIFLAGEENLLRNLNTVAKRVTFGLGSKVAEKIFTSQNYSYFAPTTRTHHQSPDKREQSFQSILDFAGF